MARGIIGKLVRGAATAGVPMLQEEHKAQILARRDEALNKIQQQYRAEDRAFQTEMNAQNQQFEAGQRDMDRAIRKDEFGATMADAAEGREIQWEGLAADRERLDLTAQQIQQQLELGEFGIVEAKRLQGINNIITDLDSTPEQTERAIEMLQGMEAENPNKFQFLKIAGEEFGDPERIYRANINTGEGEIMEVGGSGAAVFDDLPDPASYSGRTIEDEETGKRYRSNGTSWVEI